MGATVYNQLDFLVSARIGLHLEHGRSLSSTQRLGRRPAENKPVKASVLEKRVRIKNEGERGLNAHENRRGTGKTKTFPLK